MCRSRFLDLEKHITSCLFIPNMPDLTRKQRELLGKHLAEAVSDVFNCGAQVSVVGELRQVEPRYSGVFATAVFGHSSVTRDEISLLEDYGIHWVEHAPHIIQNPDMEDVESVDVEDIKDAAETKTELVVEFDEEVVEEKR